MYQEEWQVKGKRGLQILLANNIRYWIYP